MIALQGNTFHEAFSQARFSCAHVYYHAAFLWDNVGRPRFNIQDSDSRHEIPCTLSGQPFGCLTYRDDRVGRCD